ncbi:MAG: hypothetical protein IAG10_01285 [Planctomycetaceae bacterium]|nr:hypothetical protein [Planctomycetaceae bacterium]
MKTLEVDEPAFGAVVDEAILDKVVLTRGGQPVAVLVGVSGVDQEQLEYSLDENFWKWIAERRKRPRVSLAELDARYGFDKPEETAN